MNNNLSFATLRAANLARLPQFRDRHGNLCHPDPKGSDWTPEQWLVAALGELGELASERKKFIRGDITYEQYKIAVAKECADVVTYLDIFAARCFDIREVEFSQENEDGSRTDVMIVDVDPKGFDLGEAIANKWNEVSERIGCPLRIKNNKVVDLTNVDALEPQYTIFEDDGTFEVLDSHKLNLPICECDTAEDAQKICDALNA